MSEIWTLLYRFQTPYVSENEMRTISDFRRFWIINIIGFSDIYCKNVNSLINWSTICNYSSVYLNYFFSKSIQTFILRLFYFAMQSIKISFLYLLPQLLFRMQKKLSVHNAVKIKERKIIFFIVVMYRKYQNISIHGVNAQSSKKV